MKHLIIGSGIAGVKAAEAIRQYDPDSPITLIGGERFLPYCRPMIALLLGGSVTPEQMEIRKEEFFTSLRIEHVMGEWVQEIEVKNKRVHTKNGKTYSFDRLLISTGADPQRIRVTGTDLKKVFYMRNQAHVKNIISSLAGAKRALVVGCGLVGLKAALELSHRGLQVTIVERLNQPLPMVVDGEAGKMICRQLKEMGIKIITATEITALGGNGDVKEAQLSDGSKTPCDLVIVAIGVQPTTGFVPTEDILVSKGILVNQHLETAAPDIYAAGDTAESIDIPRNERRVNAIWPVAAEQGMIAGMNMAGRRVQYQGSLGRNVFRIGNMDIMAGGIVDPPQSENYAVYRMEEYRRGRYRKLVFRDDVLVGFVMVKDIEQGGVLLSLIHRKTPVSIQKERLLQPSFNVKQLLPGA